MFQVHFQLCAVPITIFSYQIIYVRIVSETWTLIWCFHKKISNLQKWNRVYKNKKKHGRETGILSSSGQVWITFVPSAIPVCCIRFCVTSMMNHTSLLLLVHCGCFVQLLVFCSTHCGSSQPSWQCCIHVTVRRAEGASLELNIQPNHISK